MSSSYYRNCKKCGRRIQLRKMPGGQWVAYEGYETIHRCDKKPDQSSNRGSLNPVNPESPAIDFLTGFRVDNVDEKNKQTGQKQNLSSNIEKQSNFEKKQTNISELIDQAIIQNQILTIRYCDKSGKITTRDIEPLSRQSNIVIANCKLRNALRHFIISNIYSAEIKENNYKQSTIDDLLNYDYVPSQTANRSSGCLGIFAFIVLFSAYFLTKI